jgi:hypothetical protein
MTSLFSTGIASAVTAADAETWWKAIATFGVGFSTVFAGLAMLMCSIMVSSYVIRLFEKRSLDEKQRAG